MAGQHVTFGISLFRGCTGPVQVVYNAYIRAARPEPGQLLGLAHCGGGGLHAPPTQPTYSTSRNAFKQRRSKSVARDDSRADTPRVAVMARAQFAANAPSPQPEAPDALAISATSLWRDDGLYELKVHTGASAGSRGNGAIGSIDNSTGGGGQLKNSCRSSNS